VNFTRQKGVTTVEMAIIATVMFTTVFAVLEVGRAMFVYNALEEATRRGARMAAVCQLNDGAIADIAVFNASGVGAKSSVVHGLRTDHIAVEYLQANGAVIGNPSGNYGAIEYVRVRLQGFAHQLFIPGFTGVFQTPQFETTLPRESLGVTRDGLQTC
jgi:hypothetical protein